MKKNKPRLLLASQSPRRKEILKNLNVSFKVVKSSYNERMNKNKTPRQLVLQHAMGKAEKANVGSFQGYVLGADTLVYCGKEHLGKPRSMKQAIQYLSLLSGRTHSVFTGLALFNRKTKHWITGVSKTKVCFKKLSEEDILKYIEKVNVMDKAGAYAIQEGPKLVKEYEGSYSNVVGLPKELLKKMLKEIVGE